MNKTTQSILLAAMLAASGFASAQNPGAPVSRAEVKSEAGTAERKLGTGETAKPNMSGSAATQGNTSGTTRAEVKADAKSEPRKLGTGEVAKSGTTSASSAERKRMRDERRAMAKAKRDGKMKSGSTATPAPASDKAP